jgi:hypothetical protein
MLEIMLKLREKGGVIEPSINDVLRPLVRKLR